MLKGEADVLLVDPYGIVQVWGWGQRMHRIHPPSRSIWYCLHGFSWQQMACDRSAHAPSHSIHRRSLRSRQRKATPTWPCTRMCIASTTWWGTACLILLCFRCEPEQPWLVMLHPRLLQHGGGLPCQSHAWLCIIAWACFVHNMVMVVLSITCISVGLGRGRGTPCALLACWL